MPPSGAWDGEARSRHQQPFQDRDGVEGEHEGDGGEHRGAVVGSPGPAPAPGLERAPGEKQADPRADQRRQHGGGADPDTGPLTAGERIDQQKHGRHQPGQQGRRGPRLARLGYCLANDIRHRTVPFIASPGKNGGGKASRKG